MKHRSVQNKYKKETDLDEIRELRSENQRLRKENKRIRKELNKLINKELETEDEFVSPLPLPNKERCPKCHSEDIVRLDLGIKNIIFCKDCKFRKVI